MDRFVCKTKARRPAVFAGRLAWDEPAVFYAGANFPRPDRNRPFAMSIFIALYLSGAAPVSAVDCASRANSGLKVFPLRKSSTSRSLHGLPAIPPKTTRESVIDVMKCPQCGGPLLILAAIQSREPIRKILDCLSLPSPAPHPATPNWNGRERRPDAHPGN